MNARPCRTAVAPSSGPFSCQHLDHRRLSPLAESGCEYAYVASIVAKPCTRDSKEIVAAGRQCPPLSKLLGSERLSFESRFLAARTAEIFAARDSAEGK